MSDINYIIRNLDEINELNRAEELFHTLSPENQVKLASTGAVRPQEIMNNGRFHGSHLLNNLAKTEYQPLEKTPLGQAGIDMGIHALPGQNTGITAIQDVFHKFYNPQNIPNEQLGFVQNPKTNTIYYPTNGINDDVQASLNSLYGNGLAPIFLRHETDEIRSGLKGPQTSVAFHNDANNNVPEVTDIHGSPRILHNELKNMQQTAPWDQPASNLYNKFSKLYRYAPEIMNLSSRQIRKLENQNRNNFQQGVNLLQNYPKENPEQYQNMMNDLQQGNYTNPDFMNLWNKMNNLMKQPVLHGTPTNNVINYNPGLQPYYNASPEQLEAQKQRQAQELQNNQNYIKNRLK